MKMSSKTFFIFQEPVIFKRSRKTHGFFMGHEFKKPHENPINSDTMKNRFSNHGFFIIIKKPWKKHGWLHFISWHFHGFFVCYSFFMGHEALNIKGIFMLFSWDSHAIFMLFFREKTHENSPLKGLVHDNAHVWVLTVADCFSTNRKRVRCT